MGITNLGAVGISAGGVYNSETVYKKYKVVSANGGSYMYINPTPAAGVPLTDTSHWQQIAEKGDTGPSAYDAAVAGEYMGTEAEFNAANAGIEAAKDAALDAAQTANEAAEIALAISTADTWERVAYFVRLGKGPQVFPVGTEFNVVTTTYGTQKFKVTAHNQHKNALNVAAPTMTLLMNRVIYSRPFDATNAIYHAPDGLAAGNYYLTLPAGYDVANGGAKSYQFTLAQAVPAGGVIMFPWAYNTDAALTKVSTFATPATTVAIESNVSVTEGTTGTFLGLADGTSPDMNHIQRARYGSNEYKYSGARRWLNSEAAANAWDVPPTKYSRPSSYANIPGFLGELPADLRSILVPVDHICARNTVFEFDGVVGGSYTVRDKIFIPSMTEVGFGSNNGIAEGTVMQLYAAATNADRIKYDSINPTVSRTWWLRSEHPSIAGHARGVYDGALNHNSAYNGYGLAPACVIG